MCGRFVLHHTPEEIAERFAVEQIAVGFKARFNIAPSQPVSVVLQSNKTRSLEAFKWGLVPFWAKDPKIGNRMINARAETAAEKPSFRAPLKYRRCLIPASGYYEWQRQGQERIPTFIRFDDKRPIPMAGLWEEWNSPEGEVLHSCTILTTAANASITPIHHRMPVILNPAQEAIWLDSQVQEVGPLEPLLEPYQDDDLVAYPVSTQVNAPSFDEPSCIEPLTSSDT